MISTGTRAMIVEATPACVYLTATSENDTPRNGPKNAPRAVAFIPALSLSALITAPHLDMNTASSAKPAIPAMILICVAAKGS